MLTGILDVGAMPFPVYEVSKARVHGWEVLDGKLHALREPMLSQPALYPDGDNVERCSQGKKQGLRVALTP